VDRGGFVSVGEALAEARSRAGLSVDELSERTRIRTAVIRCIEHDDFDACGGDLFVRGYVRALAGAVGIDARPLIREFNRVRVESSGEANVTHVARIADQVPPVDPEVTAAGPQAPAAGPQPPAVGPRPSVAGPQPPAADPAVTAADLPNAHAGPAPADPEVTAADLPIVSEDPAPTVSDLPVIPAEPGPPPRRPLEPGTPTPWVPGTWVAESRGGRARPRPRNPRSRNRRRAARVAVPAALVLAVAGVAIGLTASGQSGPPAKSAAAFSQGASHGASSSAKPATAAPTKAATAAPTKAPSPAKPAPITALPIAGAAAFGPVGLADGDNPQVAQYAVRSGSPSPWESQWYTTAHFGNLKQGTGLLIDMGRKVTITSVRIDLAGYGGADLQLRVGDSAGSPDGMWVAAHADDVGGTVRLRFSTPEHVRYLLIWFTLLPPNGAGQYQASVYHVVVNGRP
jgi:Helix-turn-helix domain